jgi:hypothetical protein
MKIVKVLPATIWNVTLELSVMIRYDVYSTGSTLIVIYDCHMFTAQAREASEENDDLSKAPMDFTN